MFTDDNFISLKMVTVTTKIMELTYLLEKKTGFIHLASSTLQSSALTVGKLGGQADNSSSEEGQAL